MSLRIVLFTRSWRPSGAQMAWRLIQAGYSPLTVVVENRGRMLSEGKKPPVALAAGLGWKFVLGKIWETVLIRLRFWMRRLLGRRFSSPDYLSIEELALDHPVKIVKVEDHNSRKVRKLLESWGTELGILTNTRRISPKVLEIPRLGFLNLHLSSLPKYAGLDSIFWALYHGEPEIGVTVHAVAPEIDRGDILAQGKIPLCWFDDEGTLYDKALWLGTHLMARAVKDLESGIAKRIPQDRSGASYFSWPSAAQRAELARRRLREPPVLPDGGRARVLHVITRLTRGGAQENTLATVREMTARGFDSVLATGPSWGSEGEILSQALEEGVPVFFIREMIREIAPLNDAIVLARLTAFMKRGRFHIVHTHTSKGGLLGRQAARMARVPRIIHTPHGHVFHSYFSGRRRNLFLFLERTAASWCHQLIALTETEKREHLELGVGTPGQWEVVPSGVRVSEFQNITPEERESLRARCGIRQGAKVAGFLGRLEAIKGPEYLVRAFSAIHRRFPESHLLLVGEGRERRRLKKLVSEAGLETHVTFAGHQPAPAPYLDLMDVVVVPSLNEGMGRVIVQAGLMGKAVIGTRVGGIPDLIEHGETGLLAEPRDVASIEAAVLELLRHPESAVRLGNHLKVKVGQGFTEDIMIEKLCRIYAPGAPKAPCPVPVSVL